MKQVRETFGFQLTDMLFDEHRALEEHKHHEKGPARDRQDHHEQDPAQDVEKPSQDIPFDFDRLARAPPDEHEGDVPYECWTSGRKILLKWPSGNSARVQLSGGLSAS